VALRQRQREAANKDQQQSGGGDAAALLAHDSGASSSGPVYIHVFRPFSPPRKTNKIVFSIHQVKLTVQGGERPNVNMRGTSKLALIAVTAAIAVAAGFEGAGGRTRRTDRRSREEDDMER